MRDDFDVNFIDLMDLLSVTFSQEFIEKWRYRFSEQFVKRFQFRLLKAYKDKKPIKKDTLYLWLRKKCGYSKEQILNFYESIDVDLYQPLIYGKLTKDTYDI